MMNESAKKTVKLMPGNFKCYYIITGNLIANTKIVINFLSLFATTL